MFNNLKKKLNDLRYDLESVSIDFYETDDDEERKEIGEDVQRILAEIVTLKHKLKDSGQK